MDSIPAPPMGFAVDSAEDDGSPPADADVPPPPKGFALDVDSGPKSTAVPADGSGDPTAYAEKLASITDPKEAGRAARAYNPSGGEPGFDLGEGIKSVAGLAADYGASVLQSGSNLARAAGLLDKTSDPLQSGADWLRKNIPLTERAKSAEKGVAGSLPSQIAAAPVKTADAALGMISPTAQRMGRGAGSLITDVGNMAAPLGTIEKFATAAPALDAEAEIAPYVAAPAQTAEENLAQQVAQSKTNMGAAASVPSLDGVSPDLKQTIASAENPNMDAVQRHVNADTLPMPEGTAPAPLRKGQALRDDQQISDEKNMRSDPDTQGILSDSINNQNNTLGLSMGEIRRRATPDIVQRSTPEHSQVAIDAIKAQDNADVIDIRSKYKDLSDQNGGAMPIDTQAVVQQVKEKLAKRFLTKTAAENPVISEIMENLTSAPHLEDRPHGGLALTGSPMTFEAFENARTNLAAVQRGGGPEAKAAAIVREALESMPMPPEAQKLKDLANQARAAAKARFDTIEQNPAYEAVVNDNVPRDPNGLHVIGAPSPLADTFMDRYVMGNGLTASRAYVARLKKVMAENPDFAPSIEASALNKLRDAANLNVYDSGNFASASFRNAKAALDKKSDVLLSPPTAANLEKLQQYSDDVSYEGKASSTNRSGTALALQRHGAQYPAPETVTGQLADMGTDVLAAKTGPVGYAIKKIGSAWWKKQQAERYVQSIKDAKLKFARDATAPGAGIDIPPASPIITRASGGRVDHAALTERLFQRWKQAQKDADKTTEPLLHIPDETITRALRLASARPTP